MHAGPDHTQDELLNADLPVAEPGPQVAVGLLESEGGARPAIVPRRLDLGHPDLELEAVGRGDVFQGEPPLFVGLAGRPDARGRSQGGARQRHRVAGQRLALFVHELPGHASRGPHHEVDLQRLARQEDAILLRVPGLELLLGRLTVGPGASALPVEVLLEVAGLVGADDRGLEDRTPVPEDQDAGAEAELVTPVLAAGRRTGAA